MGFSYQPRGASASMRELVTILYWDKDYARSIKVSTFRRTNKRTASNVRPRPRTQGIHNSLKNGIMGLKHVTTCQDLRSVEVSSSPRDLGPSHL